MVLNEFSINYVEEQYPLSIENEELNALLTTIRNQAREIETLNKELTSMRKNIEHFNEEHKLREAVAKAEKVKGKPTLILAKSVKGKGVSFMENEASWHGTAPNEEQYNKAIAELNEYIDGLGGER